MSLTAEFNGYYIPPSATSGQSAQLNDFAIYNPAGMSSQQQDFAIYHPAGMSAQLQEVGGSPVVIRGVNLATGQFQLVAPGDIVTRSDASIYNSTGINGVTGLMGMTGAAAIGATGLLGSTGLNATGISGSSGIAGIQGIFGETGVQGATGILGATGLTGTTGLTGEEGFRFLGSTGIHGQTGPTGATGVALQGVTGVLGETGIIGVTGIDGITGITSDNRGIAGIGIPGITGTAGITGITVSGLPGPFISVNIQNPIANTASYTLQANILSTDEQYLHILSWGTLNTATANTVQLTIGSSTLVNTTIYMDPQPTGYNTYFLWITVIRTSTVTQEVVAELCATGGIRYALRTSGAIDLTVTNLVTLTLSSSAVIRGLITRKGLQV